MSLNGRLVGTAGIFAACILFLATPARTQTIVHSFDGDAGVASADCDPATAFCSRQPEMNVASNGKQVTQVTRQNVNVYDYDGKLLHSTPLMKFVKDAGLNPMPSGGRAKGPFEPHIVYDEFIGRWIVTVSCLNDCFIVSDSSDPAGPWAGQYITCLQSGPCLNMDPAMHIGYDKNGVYYCGGRVKEDNPNTVPGAAYDCFAIPFGEVAAISHGTAPTHINRKNDLPLDILPAIDHNRKKASNAPEFFAARTCSRAEPGGCQRATNFSFSWLVDTFIWQGPTGAYSDGEQVIKTDIGSKENKWLYNLPCCGKAASMPQKGSTITLRAAESHRLINLVEFNSHLYGALGSGPCTADCGTQGTDTNNVMFFLDLDCSKSKACFVSQTTKISGTDFNPVFGTVGVDNKGNIGIMAESSTADTDLSILLWTHKKNDPSNTFHGPTTVVSGTQPYTCIDNDNHIVLIANAVGILTVRDPSDGSKLWTTQQWSNNATPCVWNTRIVEYQIAGREK